MDLMDEVVLSENLPGGTPKDPKLRVRTLVCFDFENTIDATDRFRWWEAEDPGPFRMLAPEYWKEEDNHYEKPPARNADYDPVDELDELQCTIDARQYF